MLDVSQYWRPQIGKCIVEAWNFADEIAEMLDPSATVRDDSHIQADYSDVVVMASTLTGGGRAKTS